MSSRPPSLPQLFGLALSWLVISTQAGCRSAEPRDWTPEEARQQLAQWRIPYTAEEFLERAEVGHREVIAAFLAAGMDPDVGGGRALVLFSGRGWTGMMKLLLEAGADPLPSPGSVINPLSAAVIGDDAEAVDLLLDAGADPNAPDASGTWPILFAKNGDMARRLIAAGADPNVGDRLGTTPLMAAVSIGDLEIVDVLLQAGADPDAVDRSGRSALLLATTHGFSSVRESLLEAGASPLPRPQLSPSTLQAYAGRYSDAGHLYLVEPASSGLVLIERGQGGLFENALAPLSATTFYRMRDPAALLFRFEVADSGLVEGLWIQEGAERVFVPKTQ